MPDEPIHCSHVKYVAEHWSLPVIDDRSRPESTTSSPIRPGRPARPLTAGRRQSSIGYHGLTSPPSSMCLNVSVLLGALLVFFAWGIRLLFPPLVTFGNTLLLALIHTGCSSAPSSADISAAATATRSGH